jgi:predicted RNA-binding protein YlqC (UPF0109 family)
MAQFDLLLTQNVHATGVEFSEKYVNLAKGSLLSGATGGTPTVLAAGTNGYHLERDDAEVTGLKWVANAALGQLHDQNTDVGTSSEYFRIGMEGSLTIDLVAESASKFGVKVRAGATYADFQAKDATFNKVTISTAPATGTDGTNKAYVDALLAANDAMVFKGSVGVSGLLEIAAFNALVVYNAGWAYKVITAGTIKGKVCEIGDMLVATVDRASGGVDADWIVLQTNIDGAVTGPASSTDNNIAVFNAATGKVIKDGGTTIAALTTLITNAQNAANAKVSSVTGTLPIVSSGGLTPAISINAATTGAAGSMSAADKLKLDGIAAGAQVNVATNLALGTVTTTTQPITNSNGTGFTLPSAIAATAAGLMSAADKTKLDGIATGAVNLVKATSADVNTGTDDAKYVTPLALEGSKLMKWWQGAAPTTKTSTGTAGYVYQDGNFMYICTAANTWKRSPIATNW